VRPRAESDTGRAQGTRTAKPAKEIKGKGEQVMCALKNKKGHANDLAK